MAAVLITILHLVAAFRFLPPSAALDSRPLYAVDYPIHTHRVYMYREGLREGGVPWGYDPALSAGTVSTPDGDLGAKPLQVVGALLPFLSPGSAVRLFLFATSLTLPLWIFLGCRNLGISGPVIVWIMLVFLGGAWLDRRIAGYLHWGLVGFVASAYLSVYVLSRFLRFLAQPRARSYLAFCAVASALFCLHILGPVVILPPLLVYSLAWGRLAPRWRLLLTAVPLIVLLINSFWVVPFFLARHVPQPPDRVFDYPAGSVYHLRFGSWAELVERLTDPILLGPLAVTLVLSAFGLVRLRDEIDRRAAISLALAAGWGLALTYLGSFVPIVARTQPMRFLVPTFAFLAVLAGAGLAHLLQRLRLPATAMAAVAAAALTAASVGLDRPSALPLPDERDPLIEFIRNRTERTDRLMIQSPDGFKLGDFETEVFPMVTGREVLGSNFPLAWDTPQFLSTWLLGRELSEWEPAALREAVERWGVGWVFALTPEAHSLFAAAMNDPGEDVGTYRAFSVPGPPSRFLIGAGRVVAKVNRLELAELRPHGEWVVLRYRYHPAWHADPEVTIYQYELPDDPAGWIALKDPPPSLTLRFRSWKALSAPWPGLDSPLRVTARLPAPPGDVEGSDPLPEPRS